MIYSHMPIIVLLFLCSLQNGVNTFTIYDARLGSGSATYQGRAEVLTSRGWLPVCNSYTYSWDSSESGVLCHQLGYNYLSYSANGSLTLANSIAFTFSCSGTESSLSQCYYTLHGEIPSCISGIVTVTCASCSSGSVQLQGSIVREAGTVEYCSGGIWKAVCDNNWDYKNAFVVCRQLGFPATDAIPYQYSYFGTHLFPLGTYFNCFGNESSLSSCQSTLLSCHSNDAAGVHCKGEVIDDLCINGHIRLAGGKDTHEGRVEVCSNGVWGTIYRSGWDGLDAIVACRQLGLYQPHSRVELLYSFYFGRGSGPVLFAYLSCSGTESRLLDCSTSNSYYFGASHSNDAGVRCQRPAVSVRSNCANGDARLVNGTTPYEGRVEICYDGVWGSVCNNGWDYRDAAIVCLQMGFQGTNATALYNSYFGDGAGPYHLSGLNCRGEESTLLNCPQSPSSSTIGYHTCSPGNDAGVRCDASVCIHGEVRLFGGYRAQYGIAEVCINGLWAAICSSGSSSTPAAIARAFCQQHTGQQSISFGTTQSCCSGRRNTGNLTLYSVSCTGQSGIFIQDCSYSIVSGYTSGGCDLQDEMTVGCYETANCNTGDVRLMDGNSILEGRVELCTQGLWGAITTSSWSLSDATVVCRQLGLPQRWALADRRNTFGRGTSRIVARDFGCNGDEMLISSCSYSVISLNSGTSYQTYSRAGVICQGNTSAPTECTDGDIRLVDGVKETEGRVEVCAYGYWAVVCNGGWPYMWDTSKTQLICKQLGLPTESSEYLSGSPFGSNYRLPLIGLYCSTGASNVSECQINNQTNYCNHRRTVGVFCKDQREYFQIKIDVSPVQESYEIGSRVTLKCGVAYSPQKYRNFVSPLRYRWYSPDGSVGRNRRIQRITISSYEQSLTSYYCLTYHRDLLLGVGRTTLNVKDVLKLSVNTSHPVLVQGLEKQRTIVLQVIILNHHAVNLLLGLTWYHNGSKIVCGEDPRLILSSNNMTLTITNFTSTYAGKYKAQYDQLLVSPFNENCANEILSLTRNYPILKPAMVCVSMDGDFSDITIDTQIWKISIRSPNSATQGTFNNLTLVANTTILSSKELEHSSIYWYRNGIRITSTPYLSTLQRRYGSLSLSQRFQQLSTTYEHSGRYEVLLKINMKTYLQAGGSTCRPYYSRSVSRYLPLTVTLAKGYIDVIYYKDLIFDLKTDKKATTRDEGATLTCQASIEFPPFSMLSFIKNRQILSLSSNSLLQIDTKTVDTKPFGLYTCQLNASGGVFQKSYLLMEQANLRVTFDVKNSTVCKNLAMAIKHIEEALFQKIKHECQCNFHPDQFQNSTINCESSSEFVYMTTLKYSNDEGSEIASTIAERIVRQLPFSIVVGGTQLTVTNACTDCDITTTKADPDSLALSPVIGAGLFFGGFAVAVFITVTLVILVTLAVKKCTKSEDKGDRRVEVTTAHLQCASAVAAHQDVSFKGPAAKYTTPHPKKPCEYQAMGPRDQPNQYDTLQHDEQPIYEETF